MRLGRNSKEFAKKKKKTLAIRINLGLEKCHFYIIYHVLFLLF